MGRHPKSALEHELAGNPSRLSKSELALRASQDALPAVVGGRPRMPKHLSAEAQECWRETIRLLKKRGILDASCGPTLEVFCEVHALWVQAKKDVEERGLEIEFTSVRKDGTEFHGSKPNPSLRVKADAEKQLLNLQKALGLTPDTRRKVAQVREKKNDPHGRVSADEWLQSRGL